VLIFERKIFRRIYGPKYENGEWKRRTNRELEEISKGENIVKWIKGQRISWLGHPDRMEEDRMPKKIFTEELEGLRRRGRHRKRWKEEVERDLQVLGVRRWRELVADRKKWKTLFDRPKPTVGCSANGRRRRRRRRRRIYHTASVTGIGLLLKRRQFFYNNILYYLFKVICTAHPILCG